jgi:SAM-dependent methyltransferase
LIKLLEAPYCYYVYLIDSDGDVDHLHYGLWTDETAGIKEAQENLSALLLAQIPPGVRAILDVGCGLGTTAYRLSTMGYRVTGISPDRNLVEWARSRYPDSDRLRLITVAFEDFAERGSFDLVLLQESSQYLQLDCLFSQSRALLRQRGYVLMCDEMHLRPEMPRFGHARQDILATARSHGFRLLRNEDLTRSVLKTREFVRASLEARYAEMCAAFAPVRSAVAEELRLSQRRWAAHNEQYRLGNASYEWFLFRKVSGPRLSAARVRAWGSAVLRRTATRWRSGREASPSQPRQASLGSARPQELGSRSLRFAGRQTAVRTPAGEVTSRAVEIGEGGVPLSSATNRTGRGSAA